MAQIRDLQSSHKSWVDHNFPDQEVWQPLLGLIEELGELSHAVLKNSQGIRGMENMAEARVLMEDAVGDIFIYLMSFCNAARLDLTNCIERTWSEVHSRDWDTFPVDGRTR